MARKIQVKRGMQSNLPMLDVGEFAFTTDQKRTYIGSSEGNIELANKEEITSQLAESVQDAHIIPYSRQKSKQVRNLVTFYFDDGLASDLTNLKPIADAKGIPLTIAAISSYNNSPLYLSDTQLRQLQSEGWQIDSHTHTHQYLATLTDEQIEDELKTSRDLLRSRGLNISSIAYPYGSHDTRVMRIASKYYRSGLGTQVGTNVVPVRSHSLFRVHMKDYTLDAMKARVDAMDNGWVIFYGHSAPNWTQDDIDKFVGLIDYVQSKNIEIVNVDEALDAFENKFEVIDADFEETDRFIIGADGKAYGPQIEKMNHVWLAPTGITNATPITSFEKRKVTTVSFTTASGSGISLGSAGAGTLVTYRVNDDDILNYQVFVPFHITTPQAPAIRYWTVGGWGAWRQQALKTDVDAIPYRRPIEMNAYPSTAVYADFPDGVSMWDINSSGSAGFPSSAGTVTMYKSAQGAGWSYQIFEQYQSATRHKRWMTNETTWSAWV